MKPESAPLWKAPAWALSLLLACLGMLGPFAVDTYLPAFATIRVSLDATPLEWSRPIVLDPAVERRVDALWSRVFASETSRVED